MTYPILVERYHDQQSMTLTFHALIGPDIVVIFDPKASR